MPMIIPAVVGFGAAAGILGTAAVGTFAFGAISLAFSSVTSLVMSGLTKKHDGGAQQSQPTFQAEARDRMHVVRSSVETRRIVYGQVMVSGPLVFAHSAGDTNQYLYLVIPLAGHEVQEIGDIYFNDELVGSLSGDGTGGLVQDGRYANHAIINKYLGTAGQLADGLLVQDSGGLWTTNHRLRGVAYLFIRLTYNQDIFPTGIPNIKAVVKGKKLYDPRTGLTVWSDTWALCVRDYLASSYGLECAAAEIDDDFVIAAANISDELVAIAGGTQKRYTCNGTVNLADRPIDIMQQLLSAGAGACVYTQGVYKVFSGDYRTPNADVIDESWLRGGVAVQPRMPRRELYNGVRGTFSDPARAWQPTDFPPVKNSTYATQDGGQVIMRDIELPFTTDGIRAQRIAKIHLEKSRQGITAVLPCNMKAFGVAVWDTVKLSIDQLAWVEKVFIVTNWKLNENGGVDLALQEEAAAVYDWALGDATIVDPAPDTVLPNPFTVGVPGALTVTEELYVTTGSSGVKVRATMSWVAAADIFVSHYQAEYRLSGAASYTQLALMAGTSQSIDDIAPGTYDFRVRSLNSIGVASAYTTLTKQLFGLTTAPLNATGFTVIKSAGFALASWDLSADLDVQINGFAVIRHSPLTSGATWNDGVILDELPGSRSQALVPLITGTYMMKFVDSTGNYSGSAVSFVAAEGMVTGFTTVGTSTQAPMFSGTKTNTVVSGSALELNVLAGNPSVGSYDFAAVLDMGSVKTRRFEADIAAVSFIDGVTFDSTEMFDSSEMFDDDLDGEINDCDATLYIATTDTDPAGGGGGGSVVLWDATMEAGNMNEWSGQYNGTSGCAGDGNFTNCPTASDGSASSASQTVSHTGSWSAKMSINGTGGVRLLGPSMTGLTEYVATCWYYFPQVYTVGGGGWNNMMQWKSVVGGSDDPLWLMGFNNNGPGGAMRWELAWWSTSLEGPHDGEVGKKSWSSSINIPTGQWVKVEARQVQAEDFSGVMQIWQDGVQIFNLTNVRTQYVGGVLKWYIGNYGANMTPSPVVVYADDVSISETQISSIEAEWTEWAPFMVGDFTSRAAKFRLDLESGSQTHNIAVSTMTVHAKIPA